MGYHFINEGTFVNDFENNDQQLPLENEDQFNEFENWNNDNEEQKHNTVISLGLQKKCPRCGIRVFQMNRHLKSCTGEFQNWNSNDNNQMDNNYSHPNMKDENDFNNGGTPATGKNWKKGKSKYRAYFEINKTTWVATCR